MKTQYYDGELVKQGASDLIDVTALAPSRFNDEDFAQVSSSSEYLPRLQICGSSTDIAKEGKIKIGHIALIKTKDSFIDLGEQVMALVIAYRPKALQLGDEIVACYNPKSELFAKIKSQSDVQDSGCMFGPEYLIWIPEIKQFATFYLSSKTARNEALNMQTNIRRAVSIRSKLITGKKYKWHGPSISGSTEVIEDMPSGDLLKEIHDKFVNPPEKEVELAESTTEDRAR